MKSLFGQILEIEYEYPDHLRGASRPKYVRAEDNVDYIIKGPSLTPEHPQVAANELIVNQLAKRLNLPVLGARVLSRGKALFYGGERVPAGTYAALTPDLDLQCSNRDIVYELACLDVWVLNGDRHDGNLLARQIARGGGSEPDRRLLVNDHSHCLIYPNQSYSDLLGLIDAPIDCPNRPPVRLRFVQQELVDSERIELALARIDSIPEDLIERIIADLPSGVITEEDRTAYVQFLVSRRAHLRAIFEHGGKCLPNLRRDDS